MLQNNYKISVVTVCLNSEATIERCFHSVADQHEFVFEHIFIDGLSNDSTINLINERYNIPNDKIIIRSEKDSGIYSAMNKGIELVRGDFVLFLNSDDELLPGVLEKFAKLTIADDVALIAGHTMLMKKNGRQQVYKARVNNKSLIYQLPHPSTFFSKGFLNSNNLTYDEKYRIAGDYKLQMEIVSRSGGIYVWDCIISLMHEGGESTRSLWQKLLGLAESSRAYREVFGSSGLANTVVKVLKKRF